MSGVRTSAGKPRGSPDTRRGKETVKKKKKNRGKMCKKEKKVWNQGNKISEKKVGERDKKRKNKKKTNCLFFLRFFFPPPFFSYFLFSFSFSWQMVFS